MKEKILRFNLYVGSLVLFCAFILLLVHISFVKRWFFIIAWWSFILIIDSLNFRRTRSSLLSRPSKDFLFVAYISVFVWLIFELFNLRLRNWSYRDLPSSLLERWTGYFLAFASVVPAMKEISLFFESILKKKFALFRIGVTPALLKFLILAGAASIFLALAWPRIFFPLTWLCFIFLLEPVNFWLNNQTFLKDIEKREWSRFWCWVLAGLVAGLLWEFWNFWAKSHWEYSLPYLNFWRVFQMPLLGYTGFLPFALEIFAFHEFLLSLRRRLQKKIILKGLAFIVLLFFYIACFHLIDRYTLIP
jgi:hypothetical protein